MSIRRLAISAAIAIVTAAMPIATASAQYYPYPYPYPPCSPFPLAWPFCVAGAVVGVAATIVSAPFRALAGAPPYWGCYPPPPYPPAGPYVPSYPPPGSAPQPGYPAPR